MGQADNNIMTINSLHISKTGRTALRFAFGNNPSYEGENYRIVFSGHPAKATTKGNFIFMVRDPVDRFVSAFNSRFKQGGKVHVGLWNEEEKKAFAIYSQANELAEDIGTERGDYYMKNICHIKDRQIDWFLKGSVIPYLDAIFWAGRTEHLDEDFEKLREKLRFPDSIQLPDKNSHFRTDGQTPSRKLSEEGRKKVAEWYKEDYKLIKDLKDNGIIK